MFTWDIPVNFEVKANTDDEAQQLIAVEVHKMIKRRGLEDIVDFDFIEFMESEETINC